MLARRGLDVQLLVSTSGILVCVFRTSANYNNVEFSVGYCRPQEEATRTVTKMMGR